MQRPLFVCVRRQDRQTHCELSLKSLQAADGLIGSSAKSCSLVFVQHPSYVFPLEVEAAVEPEERCVL